MWELHKVISSSEIQTHKVHKYKVNFSSEIQTHTESTNNLQLEPAAGVQPGVPEPVQVDQIKPPYSQLYKYLARLHREANKVSKAFNAVVQRNVK